MPFASKPFRVCHASQRKRLAGALAIIALCTLTVACSDDDQPSSTNTPGSTQLSADSSGTSSFNAPAGPSANPAGTALTIQTPATPASGTGTALSAAAPPLASPVIHTVD
jgi:hypothetical protein